MGYVNYISCVWHSTMHLGKGIRPKFNLDMIDDDNNIHIDSASIYLALIYMLYMYSLILSFLNPMKPVLSFTPFCR